jgi:hypothetical protein
MLLYRCWRASAPVTLVAFAMTWPARAETPELRAGRQEADAALTEAEAEAELPPPEVTVDVWRVPVTKPYAVREADMLRIGVEQELASPAARDAQCESARLRGAAVQADAQSRSRALSQRLEHARADQEQVERSHLVHQQHLALAERTLTLAQARHEAGGSLNEVTLAQLEAARARAELAGDQARAASAAQVVTTLVAGGVVDWRSDRGERPELAALRLSREAELQNARSEQARSAWPDFRVGVSYFAPTLARDEHGFGVTLGMKLPWAWGAKSGKARAARSRAEAFEAEREAKLRDLQTDAAVVRGQLQAAEASLHVTREQTLPLAEQNQKLALASYESSAGKLEDTLRAEALRLEIQMEVVRLEAEIAHLKIDVRYLEGGKHVR